MGNIRKRLSFKFRGLESLQSKNAIQILRIAGTFYALIFGVALVVPRQYQDVSMIVGIALWICSIIAYRSWRVQSASQYPLIKSIWRWSDLERSEHDLYVSSYAEIDPSELNEVRMTLADMRDEELKKLRKDHPTLDNEKLNAVFPEFNDFEESLIEKDKRIQIYGYKVFFSPEIIYHGTPVNRFYALFPDDKDETFVGQPGIESFFKDEIIRHPSGDYASLHVLFWWEFKGVRIPVVEVADSTYHYQKRWSNYRSIEDGDLRLKTMYTLLGDLRSDNIKLQRERDTALGHLQGVLRGTKDEDELTEERLVGMKVRHKNIMSVPTSTRISQYRDLLLAVGLIIFCFTIAYIFKIKPR